MTITEFINARLGEDEAALSRSRNAPEDAARFVDADHWSEPLAWMASEERVAREIEAKRKILAEHEQWATGGMTGCHVCHADAQTGDPSPGPCDTLRHLAAIWDGHPDYQQEWRPQE